MGVVLGNVFGEGADDPKMARAVKPLNDRRTAQTPNPLVPTCRKRNGVSRNGMGARTRSLNAPDNVLRTILVPMPCSGGSVGRI